MPSVLSADAGKHERRGLRGSHYPASRPALEHLHKSHRDFDAAEKSAAAIYHIKKLAGVAASDGQYRLSVGRWRFRYDILHQVVLLSYCGRRREDTY